MHILVVTRKAERFFVVLKRKIKLPIGLSKGILAAFSKKANARKYRVVQVLGMSRTVLQPQAVLLIENSSEPQAKMAACFAVFDTA